MFSKKYLIHLFAPFMKFLLLYERFELTIILLIHRHCVFVILECIITARKLSLGQGNVFTPVCDSFHGGCLTHCMLIYTPLSRHSPRQTPPMADTPWEDTPPPRQTPPRADGPSWADAPQDTTEYGQQTGGTYPTGMHTCF